MNFDSANIDTSLPELVRKMSEEKEKGKLDESEKDEKKVSRIVNMSVMQSRTTEIQ